MTTLHGMVGPLLGWLLLVISIVVLRAVAHVYTITAVPNISANHTVVKIKMQGVPGLGPCGGLSNSHPLKDMTPGFNCLFDTT